MWNPITPSDIKRQVFEEAKKNGNTHSADLYGMAVLMLTCKLADALNHINKLEKNVDNRKG